MLVYRIPATLPPVFTLRMYLNLRNISTAEEWDRYTNMRKNPKELSHDSRPAPTSHWSQLTTLEIGWKNAWRRSGDDRRGN